MYECLGLEPPEEVKGYTQWPLEGTSFKYSFEDGKAKTQKPSQFYVMLGTRAIWRDGWKADAVHPGAPSDWSHFTDDKWALYNVEVDRSECHDLADKHPELLEELKALWHVQAGQFLGLPLENRGAIAVLTTPRLQMSPPRDRYHGHHFGGHALYLSDGTLKYVSNYLGEAEQAVVADAAVPTGKHVLGVEFSKESQTPQATVGSLTLFVNDKQVGTLANVKIQNGKFALCG